jgi:hypothetical protein
VIEGSAFLMVAVK